MTRPGGSSERPGPAAPAGRAAARLAAVQALYQMKMTGERVQAVVDEFMTHHLAGPDRDSEVPELGKADLDFFRDLVEGVASQAASLDDMLAAVLAEDWPVERLESVLGLILRAGAFELGHRPDVPPRVVVSQYVDLAHAFLDDKQTAMVNGVLDRLARHLRPEAFAGEALPDLAG